MHKMLLTFLFFIAVGTAITSCPTSCNDTMIGDGECDLDCLDCKHFWDRNGAFDGRDCVGKSDACDETACTIDKIGNHICEASRCVGCESFYDGYVFEAGDCKNGHKISIEVRATGVTRENSMQICEAYASAYEGTVSLCVIFEEAMLIAISHADTETVDQPSNIDVSHIPGVTVTSAEFGVGDDLQLMEGGGETTSNATVIVIFGLIGALICCSLCVCCIYKSCCKGKLCQFYEKFDNNPDPEQREQDLEDRTNKSSTGGWYGYMRSSKTTPSEGDNKTPDRTNTKTKGKKAAFGVPSLFGRRDVELANGSDSQKTRKDKRRTKNKKKARGTKKPLGE